MPNVLLELLNLLLSGCGCSSSSVLAGRPDLNFSYSQSYNQIPDHCMKTILLVSMQLAGLVKHLVCVYCSQPPVGWTLSWIVPAGALEGICDKLIHLLSVHLYSSSHLTLLLFLETQDI